MNRKQISYSEWMEIGICNYAAKWLRPLCRYDLIKEPDGQFKREQRISFLVYLILFIPAHIIQALWCMWDGGLREFEFAKRYLGGDWLASGSIPFDTAEKIWKEKENENPRKFCCK